MADAPIRRPRLTSALLAYSAGFVDTCGFVALFGLFTAHVTGNFVLLAKALVAPEGGVIAKLLALPTFMLAVALTRIWIRAHRRRGWTGPTAILLTEITLLSLFLAAGLAASPIGRHETEATIVAGLLGVAAMGVQNAAARQVFASITPTTVMTGNVTQLVLDAVDLALAGDAEERRELRGRLAKSTPAILAFAGGAASGAIGYGLAGFACLALPIVALAAIVLVHADGWGRR